MNHPVLDHRDLEAIRAQVAALARSYTPEWRYESTEDDPGAALAEMFCTMFYQTVDRMNALPEKLYIEFLNQIGYQEPGPVSAQGVMQFTPHDTVEQAVRVPSGTRVFTSDPEGENVVYETQRSIEASPARITDLYFVDGKGDRLEQMDPARPGAFFAPGGRDIQDHAFYLCENDVLWLDKPCTIAVELRQNVRYLEQDTARLLTAEGMSWSYRHGGVWLPFDSVKEDNGRILLEKRTSLALEPDESGRICLRCKGRPAMALTLQQASLTSEPLSPSPAGRLFSGDVPIETGEGGYCFGSRPSVYSMFYIRQDAVLTKRGAQASLALEIVPVVFDPPAQGPNYLFTQPIIDKRSAVAIKPDDVRVSGVVWEYYNGMGWRPLEVSGSRNPFSCRQEGPYAMTFQVPADIQPTEVNAETGWYIRARVTEMENLFSMYQRWVVPLCKGAELQWHYPAPVPVRWIASDNNGKHREMESDGRISDLQMRVLEPLAPGPAAMYFCFDRPPRAVPLSVYFQMKGRARINGQLLWERWNGKAFETVRAIDETEQMLHSGSVYLFLAEDLPQAEFFGVTGCWLRLSCTGEPPKLPPVVTGIQLNTSPAVQCRQEPEQRFDTGIYETGKTLQLLARPVQKAEVWVDELTGLSAAEAGAMAREQPGRVRLEEEDHILSRCWVLWEEIPDLALAGQDDRVYVLDRYQGIIRFGDGRQGRVPPAGDHNILVTYASGGGSRGNIGPGEVTALLEGLPRISTIRNLTAMSGGTDRLTLEEIESRGSRHLRTRGRAASGRDFEDLVRQGFPQVQHVRCFSGKDPEGRARAGHVTVVVSGYSKAGEDTEALCRQVYEYLSSRCSCCLVAEGRLHVCPATVLTVNTQITVELDKPELAADTQQEIIRRVEALIGKTWHDRPIGSQIRMDELWSAVRGAANVRSVKRLLAEGAYDRQGQACLAPLEQDGGFPYGIVESGTHTVRVQ